jgi:hypothetical protein
MKRIFFLFAVLAVVFFLNRSVTAQEWDHMEQPNAVICKDSAFPTSIAYGFVALGAVNTHIFSLYNTGNTTLDVQSIDGISYPVVSVHGIAPGTVIPMGQANGIDIGVDMDLTSYIDTTVILTIHFQSDCPAPMFETLQIAASFINPTNTGHPFPSTFLDCRVSRDSITARLIGTTNLTLKSISIGNQSPAGLPQFFFENGSDTLTVNKVFTPGTRMQFHVVYAPTIEGPVSATIMCEWDSAGVKRLFSSNILTGIGRLERDTVSLMPASGLPYSAKTNGTIDVPVNLTTILPADVQANGMTFSVTYNDYLFKYLSSVPNPSLKELASPAPVSNGYGTDTLTFDLQSLTSPITALAPVVTIHFQVIAAKETVSSIDVPNVIFWGENPFDTLCYVLTAAFPAIVQIANSSDVRENLPSNTIEVITQGKNEVVVISNNERTGNTSVRIFSLLGVEVASWEGTMAGNSRKIFSVPVSGEYFIRVRSGGKEYFFKRVL